MSNFVYQRIVRLESMCILMNDSLDIPKLNSGKVFESLKYVVNPIAISNMLNYE